MWSSSVFVVVLLSSIAVAQPHKHDHGHGRFHNKVEQRGIVWETDWVYVTETDYITTTLWVDAVEPTSAAAVTPTTTKPAQFYQTTTTQAAPTPSPPSSSAYVAPPAPVSPVQSSTSVYVAPVVSVTPVAEVLPTSTLVFDAHVAPTTTSSVVVPATSAAPVPIASTPPSSGYSGSCSSGSPCSGDITFYDAGLGACGITTNGDAEAVVALPHGLMGTQSNGNPFCGKTVTISLGGKTVAATVVDKCMGCEGNSIDLSNKAFAALADFSVGRTQAKWWFN